MTVKKVWAFIFIVLGVGFAISGYSILSDLQLIDKSMSGLFSSKSGIPSLDAIVDQSYNQFADASRAARLSGWFRVVLGVCFSLLGTFMFKDDEKVQDALLDIDQSFESDKYTGFRMK